MKKLELKPNLPLLILIILIIMSFFIIKDVLVAIISSYVLAFLLRPFYLKLSKKLSPSFSSFLSVLIAILIIILPIAIIVGTSFTELSSLLSSDSLSNIKDSITNNNFLSSLNLPFDITQQFLSLLAIFLESSTSLIPLAAVYILILIFGTYYILIEWDSILSKIKKYLIIKNQPKILNDISSSTKEIVYGTFLIALIELLIAGIVLWTLKIKFAFVLATLMALFAFIPGLGPLLIWVPLAIYLFLQASYLKMTIVIIMGLILSIYVDGILRAQVTGKKSNIHPFIMLIGILGGISVFGIFGFIIGPIILATTLKIWDEFIS